MIDCRYLINTIMERSMTLSISMVLGRFAICQSTWLQLIGITISNLYVCIWFSLTLSIKLGWNVPGTGVKQIFAILVSFYLLKQDKIEQSCLVSNNQDEQNQMVKQRSTAGDCDIHIPTDIFQRKFSHSIATMKLLSHFDSSKSSILEKITTLLIQPSWLPTQIWLFWQSFQWLDTWELEENRNE